MSDHATRLRAVTERIAEACRKTGRAADEVTLVAVSKGHDLSAIETLHGLGVRDFGESYAQEWRDKVDHLPDDVRWHFIGHLQSNKVRMLADRVHLVHSVDRSSLLRELDKRWSGPCEILLQLNVAEDPAKSGAAADEAFALLDRALESERLVVRGLMTIPALSDDPEGSRPAFAALREIFETIRSRYQLERFDHLSMGMTDDLEIAIEEGATIVRVGTALFGPRSYP